MAERTKKTILRVESGARGAAKTITGITAASPGVVSAASHGFVNGDVVYISGVVGMTEVNDRAFVVANSLTGTFELKGVKTTNYTPYVSGGSVSKVTLTKVGEVTSITVGGGGSQQIDVTHLESDAIEQLAGLPNLGTISMDITLNHTDSGQSAYRDLFDATTPQVLTITTATGFTLCATGYASNISANFPVNDAQRGSFEFTVYRRLTWFA
jgi:hypothetical protein